MIVKTFYGMYHPDYLGENRFDWHYDINSNDAFVSFKYYDDNNFSFKKCVAYYKNSLFANKNPQLEYYLAEKNELGQYRISKIITPQLKKLMLLL